MKKTSLLAAFAAAVMIGNTAPATAQETSGSSFSAEQMIDLTEGFHIGYIESGSNRLDSYTEAGLEILSTRVLMDTRVPIQNPTFVGLDLERDDLNLFPVIFWTVTNQSDTMSEQARERLQNYIDHGGILFLDTSDISTRSACAGLMEEIIGHLDTRPFIEMPVDHTLTKTFYLLHDFTAEQSRNPFCLESNDEHSIESLSNVIISDIGALRELVPQQTSMGPREREMLTRQLVNLIMYANTGDYKTDLTHLPAILERMESNGPN